MVRGDRLVVDLTTGVSNDGTRLDEGRGRGADRAQDAPKRSDRRRNRRLASGDRCSIGRPPAPDCWLSRERATIGLGVRPRSDVLDDMLTLCGDGVVRIGVQSRRPIAGRSSIESAADRAQACSTSCRCSEHRRLPRPAARSGESAAGAIDLARRCGGPIAGSRRPRRVRQPPQPRKPRRAQPRDGAMPREPAGGRQPRSRPAIWPRTRSRRPSAAARW